MSSVGDPVAGVHSDANGRSRRHRENATLIYVYGWGAEGFKYDLGHLFTIGFWVGGQGSLLFTGIAALVPDLLLVLPVGGKLGSMGHFRIRVPLLF